jgi:antitoxin HicB
MGKDLNYYLSLDYPIEIRRIPKEDGGGYLASIPQLGEKAFRADGATIDEALANLKKIKRYLFIDYLKEGLPIAEPEPEPESIFSGKFVVRIPATLHRELVESARKRNVSLNHHVVHLLSYNTPLVALERKLEECFDEIRSTLSSIDVAFKIHPKPAYGWKASDEKFPRVA